LLKSGKTMTEGQCGIPHWRVVEFDRLPACPTDSAASQPGIVGRFRQGGILSRARTYYKDKGLIIQGSSQLFMGYVRFCLPLLSIVDSWKYGSPDLEGG
jgi:hypothetical protein